LCSSVKSFDIILAPSGGSFGFVNDDYIVVALSQVGLRDEDVLPGGVFGYSRIIAHEFGHAILGYEKEWGNVAKREPDHDSAWRFSDSSKVLNHALVGWCSIDRFNDVQTRYRRIP
jgi:hypothetical protein